MQYALLIYSEPGAAEALGADEQEAVHRQYMEIKEEPEVIGGASLHPVETATTVRVHEEQVLITDGPFADTKEVFAGLPGDHAVRRACAARHAAQARPCEGRRRSGTMAALPR